MFLYFFHTAFAVETLIELMLEGYIVVLTAHLDLLSVIFDLLLLILKELLEILI